VFSFLQFCEGPVCVVVLVERRERYSGIVVVVVVVSNAICNYDSVHNLCTSNDTARQDTIANTDTTQQPQNNDIPST
jgi:hypothetical protein